MTSAGQRLTLCTLVPDDGQLLPGCLDSVRGVVDEVVVVLCGPGERMLEVAGAWGAPIVRRAQADDLAAARNAGLAAVRTGWVLVLDASERLAPGSGPALRAAMACGRIDCGELALHEADTLEAPAAEVVTGRARRAEPVLVPRLLRRTDDLAFEGIVAEDLRAWMRAGRRIETLEADIIHYGAVPELPGSRERAQLRLRLLERRCAAEPADPLVRALLARELLRAGDEARGTEAARQAWRLLEAATPAQRAESDVVLVATLHAFRSLAQGDLDRAAGVLASACEWSETHPNLELLAGALMESLALGGISAGEQSEALATARAAYERCLDQHGRPFRSQPLPGATSWAARTRLATVDLICGRPDEALAGFELALASNPRLAEAHLGRIEALLDLGMAAEALQGLEPWLAAGSPDAWTLAAAAAAALGSAQDAVLFTERARDSSATLPWAGPHRRLRLQALAALAA